MAQVAENGTAESVPAHQFARLRRGTSPTEGRISGEVRRKVERIAEFPESPAAGNFET